MSPPGLQAVCVVLIELEASKTGATFTDGAIVPRCRSSLVHLNCFELRREFKLVGLQGAYKGGRAAMYRAWSGSMSGFY